MDTIDRMTGNLKAVTSIDADLMSLMQLEGRVILGVQANNVLFSDLDEVFCIRFV